jgi:hypothetical protein
MALKDKLKQLAGNSELRNKAILVYFTNTEHEELKTIAKEIGCKKSKYLQLLFTATKSELLTTK